MNRYLYDYEVFLSGETTPSYTFQSNYAFDNKEHNKLFFTVNGHTVCCIITKMTHGIEEGVHRIRLNCIVKKN
jgi:hypothetical protein